MELTRHQQFIALLRAPLEEAEAARKAAAAAKMRSSLPDVTSCEEPDAERLAIILELEKKFEELFGNVEDDDTD